MYIHWEGGYDEAAGRVFFLGGGGELACEAAGFFI